LQPPTEIINDVVALRRKGNVAQIVVDNPPVNSISQLVLSGISEATRRFVGEAELQAAIIICAGSSFSTGADIFEVDSKSASLAWKEVDRLIENCPKPIVAAMHRHAFGGGFELALACHFRIAEEDTKFGLPEVALGLIPGGGGTQRLPRIAGLAFALDTIPSGRIFGVEEALDHAVIDRVAPKDKLEQAAWEYAAEIAAQGISDERVPRSMNRSKHLPEADAAGALFDTAKETVSRKWPRSEARLASISAIENGLRLPFSEALDMEADIFERLVETCEHRALKHLFFAERHARHVPGAPHDVGVRKISRVGVVGGGQMGRGIALTLVAASIPTCIIETSDELVTRSLATCHSEIDRAVGRGSISSGEGNHRRSLLSASTDQKTLADCDLIIEAVFEDLELKKSILASLDRIANRGAILASNTSNLDINEIARCTSRPGDVIGLHFFNPAPVMRLLEIIPGSKTKPEVLMSAIALAKKLRKQPVVAQVCDGFIVNRIFDRYSLEAEFLVEEGASPYAVDAALRDFGMAMGPFQTSDLVGIDIGQSIRKRKWQELPPGVRWPRVEEEIFALGRLGQKTQAGWYSYLDSRAGMPDPIIEELVRTYREKRGDAGRAITPTEIVERCIFAMVSEGAKILEEKVAFRASDIDVAIVHGIGFPSWRGGPMFHGTQIGLQKINSGIEAFSEANAYWWHPAKTLSTSVETGSLA